MLLLGEWSEATEPYNKYDKIRPHSIRSLQFDQKVRPLSFRAEKFDLFTATHLSRLPVTWLNTIWLNFFVESFGLKILSQVTTKLSQLHSNSRNKNVNSRKYHNVGHMRCMHARPHRRKDQLPLRSLRDLRSR